MAKKELKLIQVRKPIKKNTFFYCDEITNEKTLKRDKILKHIKYVET